MGLVELVEVKTLSAKVVVALHSAQRLQPLEVGAVLRGMLLTLVEGEEVAAVEEQEVREVITLVVLVATLMVEMVEMAELLVQIFMMEAVPAVLVLGEEVEVVDTLEAMQGMAAAPFMAQAVVGEEVILCRRE